MGNRVLILDFSYLFSHFSGSDAKMKATDRNSTPAATPRPTGNGKEDKIALSVPKWNVRWRFTPPSDTALVLFALRVLISALSLVLAIILTPGISLQFTNPNVSLTAGLILMGIIFGILNTL